MSGVWVALARGVAGRVRRQCTPEPRALPDRPEVIRAAGRPVRIGVSVALDARAMICPIEVWNTSCAGAWDRYLAFLLGHEAGICIVRKLCVHLLSNNIRQWMSVLLYRDDMRLVK